MTEYLTPGSLQLSKKLDGFFRGVLTHYAEALGIGEAFFLSRIDFWSQWNAVHHNPDTHHKDARWWVYNTYDNWAKDLPFYSKETLRRFAYELESLNLIGSRSDMNKRKGDQTKWYAIDYSNLRRFMTVWNSHGCPNKRDKDPYKDFVKDWNTNWSFLPGQLAEITSPTGKNSQTVTSIDQNSPSVSPSPTARASDPYSQQPVFTGSTTDDGDEKDLVIQYTSLERVVMEASRSKQLTKAMRRNLATLIQYKSNVKNMKSPNELYNTDMPIVGDAFRAFVKYCIDMQIEIAKKSQGVATPSRGQLIKVILNFSRPKTGWFDWYQEHNDKFKTPAEDTFESILDGDNG